MTPPQGGESAMDARNKRLEIAWAIVESHRGLNINRGTLAEDIQRALREHAEEAGKAATLAERERCALLCESMRFPEVPTKSDLRHYDIAFQHAASAIRSTEQPPAPAKPDGVDEPKGFLGEKSGEE